MSMTVIDMVKTLFNFKLTVAGILFAIFGIALMILRFCHQKKGKCSREFEIFLLVLDWIVILILFIRILGYTLELTRKK